MGRTKICKQHTDIKCVLATDVDKSLIDNMDKKLQHFEKIKQRILLLEQQILEQKTLMNRLDINLSTDRIAKARIKSQIHKLTREIISLEKPNDTIEYLQCIATVMDAKSDINMKNISNEVENFETAVNMCGPVKPRLKKKVRDVHTNMARSKSIMSMMNVKESEDKLIHSTKLAQLLGELPSPQHEIEYCNKCINKALIMVEKPPSLVCPECGTSRSIIDVGSTTIHDKDNTVHIPYAYKPKQHFYSWIKRVTGKCKYNIEQDVIDAVMLELHNMRILDVNRVSFEIVNSILRKLSKNADKRFSDAYQQVYQITNIIRGAPILVLTDVQEQELLDLFDIVFESWERHKGVERDNFLSNAFTLQLCFHLLEYPDEIVSMFNSLKGAENVKEYDRICTLICKDLGKPPVRLAALHDAKLGKTQNVMQLLKACKSKSSSPSK